MRSISLARVNGLLLLALLALALLYYGRLFLIPVAFSIVLAMLLSPVSRWLESWGLGRGFASFLCLVLLLLVLAAMGWAIGEQAANISEQLPQIQAKLQQLLNQGQQLIQREFGVTPKVQIEFVQEQISKIAQSANRYLTTSLKGIFGLLGGFVLVLLYLFFLLWQRGKFREFLLRLAPAENRSEYARMLHQIRQVSGQYLVGRLISIVFLAVFYGIGFSIIGLQNAVLLGLIAAFPTIVPYVGAFVGGLFPLIMALIGGSSGQVLPTVGIMVAAQVIDNNIIEPLVMGANLNLSPIFTIVAIVLGELIWGVPGMILFEPLFAIIRIICSHVPALHPYAFLLEDEMQEPQWLQKLKHVFSRSKT
ncbi:AI-2E family transporter [Hymenobacter qilianensis]|uniref:AI-2E family transporter n=2 Tax=Hymenobacter qilianensis TaxID=1385715 RepID=A0ACB5PVX2_9BACT|nr:AI-2E family transporter [Hymenobacter qilianensis]QNP51225.1 AI-2E family transporter [Hymenobacter qilianensis]GGF77236.1 AI-2E family transporter [Hymenobacter qilianensis]